MQLNEAQQRAVESTAALRVVLAGPGSGKTRTEVEAVLAARGKVAIMTFTNSAANEFRKRIERLTPDHPMAVMNPPRNIVHCGTLHSYCFKLIQRYGARLGYIAGKVGILPDAEKIPRLLACRDKLGFKTKVSEKALLKRESVGFDGGNSVALIWRDYEFLLKRNNLVDYDGILRVGRELLGLSSVQAQARLDYLFVDEAQDSAEIDWEIYDAIPATNKMYVGDPDQSIFAFRGAWPQGLYDEARAIDVELHKLELNYRSDMDICIAANNLIAHNKDRVDKVTRSVSIEAGDVAVFGHEDVGQELGYLAGSINEAQRGGSVAVLYRNHYEANQCRDYLVGMGLPVQKFRFEQRPKDWERAVLLIGLQLMPTEILVERFLLLELGPKEVARLKLESQASGGQFIAASRIKAVYFENPVAAMPYLMMNGVSESTARAIQGRAELLGPGAELSDLLHELHGNEDNGKTEPEGGGIYVGTIHSAKGREFDVVFLPAFEQGIIPHTRLLTGEETAPKSAFPGCLEEERRLAFVAVTRARHELFISHVAYRRGRWGPVGGLPSQFIKEMGL